jgi:hypothetical protein
MEAADSLEKFVPISQTTLCHVPSDSNVIVIRL